MSVFVGALQQVIAKIPPWFARGRYGSAFLEALGLTLDVGTETLTRGLRQRYPLACEETSLSVVGGDVGIVRRGTETTESYRKRCAQWRQIKKHSGSHYGQMINLQPFFLPGTLPRIRIVHQMGDGSRCTWHTLNPDGTYEVHRAIPSNWNWDDVPAKWSRFWVIIDVSGLDYNGAAWGDGTTWTDGSTVWGGYLSSDQRADIIAIINESKAVHTILWGLVFATDPDSFDPTSTAVTDVNGATSLPVGNWGSAIDPATGHASRLSTALFPFSLGQG